jgi:alkanesulfonate monooxygenase SsuD/methylene tetrahydromethanopterin reductase-like flavin-dependent oxidoreductase (luciferase family)
MSSGLRFGILVLQTDPWPNIVERVQSYEALGLDSVHLADHFVHYGDPAGPWFECWTLLAGLALQTSRIRLGPLVSHPIFRNPALLARQAMTLDHLSGGRLELGLGTGASDYDWTMTRGSDPWPFAERVERFHELVEIVDRLLRDGTASYQGRHYQVADATLHPRPVQQPRLPLTIAASGARMVKLAARYADIWITEGNYRELWQGPATAADVLRLTRERNQLLSQEAIALGRDPRAITRAFLAGYSPGLEAPWGSVEAFKDFVGRYGEMGCSQFVLPEPQAEEASTFERIVREIIPRLRQGAR